MPPRLVPRIGAHAVHETVIHGAVNVHSEWASARVHTAHSAVHHRQAGGRVDGGQLHVGCAWGGIGIAAKKKIEEVKVHCVLCLVVRWLISIRK